MRAAIVISLCLLVLLGLALGWFSPSDVGPAGPPVGSPSPEAMVEGLSPLPEVSAQGDQRGADPETEAARRLEAAVAVASPDAAGEAAESVESVVSALEAPGDARDPMTSEEMEVSDREPSPTDMRLSDATVPPTDGPPGPPVAAILQSESPEAELEAATRSSQESGEVYVVREGDSLGSIAREHYGVLAQYRRIYEENRDRIADPNRIYPGQKLVIPTEP